VEVVLFSTVITKSNDLPGRKRHRFIRVDRIDDQGIRIDVHDPAVASKALVDKDPKLAKNYDRVMAVFAWANPAQRQQSLDNNLRTNQQLLFLPRRVFINNGDEIVVPVPVFSGALGRGDRAIYVRFVAKIDKDGFQGPFSLDSLGHDRIMTLEDLRDYRTVKDAVV